jgi:hypothetical protein
MDMLGFAWLQILKMMLHAFLSLFINPVLYLGTILIIWDLVRNISAERRFFGIRLTRVFVPQVIRYLKAICIGVGLTFVALVLHIEVRPGEIFTVAGISILLGVVRLRLAGTSYAISLFLAFVAVAKVSLVSSPPVVANMLRYLTKTSAGSWIQLLALLFLAQLLLVAWSRNHGAAPVLVSSKRGRELGAVVIQWSFIVPLGVFVPGQFSPSVLLTHFNWLSLIGTISLAAIPGLVGWHGVVSTISPKRAASQIVWMSGFCMILLTGLVAFLHYTSLSHSLICLIGAVIGFVIPELHVWRVKWLELHEQPVCQPSEDGVVVLFTIPGSLAEQIGLKMGEIITHVNQVPVHSEYDLHFALDQNPAYAKLQVIDTRGEIRIVGKPVYAGERYQLGAILVSGTGNVPMYHKRPVGLLQTLYLRLAPTGYKQAGGTETVDLPVSPL